MIDFNFLYIEFTKVTLMHILLMLGIPYIVFYIFEKVSKFDKFFEKWEAALFVFVFGALITLASINIQETTNIPFWLIYIYALIFLLVILIIIYFFFFNKKSKKRKFILIELNNQTRYNGLFCLQDSNFLKLVGTKKDPIQKINFNKEKNEYEKAINIEYAAISINLTEIKKIIG